VSPQLSALRVGPGEIHEEVLSLSAQSLPERRFKEGRNKSDFFPPSYGMGSRVIRNRNKLINNNKFRKEKL